MKQFAGDIGIGSTRSYPCTAWGERCWLSKRTGKTLEVCLISSLFERNSSSHTSWLGRVEFAHGSNLSTFRQHEEEGFKLRSREV